MERLLQYTEKPDAELLINRSGIERVDHKLVDCGQNQDDRLIMTVGQCLAGAIENLFTHFVTNAFLECYIRSILILNTRTRELYQTHSKERKELLFIIQRAVVNGNNINVTMTNSAWKLLHENMRELEAKTTCHNSVIAGLPSIKNGTTTPSSASYRPASSAGERKSLASTFLSFIQGDKTRANPDEKRLDDDGFHPL